MESWRIAGIWRAGTLLHRAIRSRRMGKNITVLDQFFRQISHVDVVSKTLGDARKAIAYRKSLRTELNFLKVFIKVDGMCENRLFFDSNKGRKTAALSMSEKTWPN